MGFVLSHCKTPNHLQFYLTRTYRGKYRVRLTIRETGPVARGKGGVSPQDPKNSFQVGSDPCHCVIMLLFLDIHCVVGGSVAVNKSHS